ncbi:pyridoxal-phosphate dependent enzyme [soil metagenome]
MNLPIPSASVTAPTLPDVEAAAVRIGPHVHRTPVFTSRLLDAWAGAELLCKCENLQRVGAFKIRGATNAVRSLTDDEAARGVVAHSSGNHGAALALAASDRGIAAHVVMPANATAAKLAAVAAYGARITLCEPTLASRESTLAAVVADTGAIEIHPFDDDRIIAGAGTAALELLDDVPALDTVVAPVGGGGLLSGTAIAVTGRSPATRVVGAEPSAVDDAHRSLTTGARQPPTGSPTIADGLRTALSDRTFAVITAHVEGIVTVDEDAIVAAMRVVWERMKLIIEPSAAGAVAAIATGQVPGRRIGVILSGGNVDLDALPF